MSFDLSSFCDLPQETQIALLVLGVIVLVAATSCLKLLEALLKNLRSAVTLAIVSIASLFLFGWVLPSEVSAEVGTMVGSCVARPFYIAREWEMQNVTVRTKVLVELAGYAAINVAVLSSVCLVLSRSRLAFVLACILGVSIAAALGTLGVVAQLAPVQVG